MESSSSAISSSSISRPVRVFIVALLLGITGLMAGCGLMNGKKEAETVISRHFQTIATNGFDAALTDYGAPFFSKTSQDEWKKALTNITKKLGTYQSHTVTSWRVYENSGSLGAGTTVSLECEVVYSKHSATESFTLFKAVGDKDYKIIGHHIDSTALLTE